ncbi:MAG: 2-dehydropantoate 2-reductase [Candidatus Scalindua rubra]|uniref:2-dehydropantoate 2-reductase n=1 Tax=Candidatus Scalindua rubra TaxID=1872076 RepID=A0A1E3X9Q8_9BACT|nr:MAG: 2-dehydropantoate 2-reductase [Candidatus Scalindua rubra]
MKILVIGAGAVGGYFGGILAKGGEDVTFVARGKYLDSLKTAGLKIRSYKGYLSLRVNAIENPEEIGEVDLILMCVKSYDTEEAALQCMKNIGERTIVLSLQNGIDNEERIARVVGKNKVLGGAVFICSEVNKSWEICHYTAGKIIIGELDGRISDRVRKIAEIFKKVNIPCSISNDIQKELWKKLVWNAAFNSVSAITRSNLQEIMECEETRELIRLTMMEVLNIAKGIGHNLDERVIEEYLVVPERSREIRTSTLQDLLKSKPLEIDAINGVVVTNGKKLGIPTPYNSSLYALLKLINKKP